MLICLEKIGIDFLYSSMECNTTTNTLLVIQFFHCFRRDCVTMGV